ncbi:unnamed protein product [Closterium sp. Naga37s-1]|nr:unnamed protein product [Closterium sp. Naga37s-1]
MLHSSEAIGGSASPSLKAWSREVRGEEDAVLLRHALQCGTKQWGELERSGQLKRSNKSCCNRYIFLRRKFTHRFRNNILRKHLDDAASLQRASLDGHSQPIFFPNFKQQQQQQQWQRAGVGSPELAFGGLSFDECTAVFFAPNARCRHPALPPKLPSFASPPPVSQATHFASQAATFTAAATAAASTLDFTCAHDAFPVAATSNAVALRRPVKRPRDDCAGLGADQPLLRGRESRLMPGGVMSGGMVRGGMRCEGVSCCTQRRRQSVAEQFQLQGESRCVQQQGGASSGVQQAEDEALMEALLQEEHRQQQPGGARSRAQRVLWPRVGSESALPDDVLLGLTGAEPTFTQRAALSAPPPTHPRIVLPAPMPSELTAPPGSALCFGNSILCCGDSAPCFGYFSLQPVEWPRVGSESALPDDVLLGLCCEGPAFSPCSAPSAPPPTPLPAPMPSMLAAPRGCALGSDCATHELEYLDACIEMLANGNNSNDSNANNNNGNGDEALFLDTPVAHMLLGGRTLTEHCGSGPQQHALAAPGAAGAGLPEWAVEQGGAWEGGAQRHQHRQLKGCGRGELERILSHRQLLQPLSQTPMQSAPTQPLLYAVPSALNTPSNPRSSHMQVPIQPRPAMLQQPFPTGGALPALCQPHAASLARHGLYSER